MPPARLRLDPARCERLRQSPVLGPRLLFFSGGTALRPLSRVLRRYTHNSLHLITPFDSGGSTAALREALGIFGVGDLRNRLLALAADDEPRVLPVIELLSHRLASEAQPTQLSGELEDLIAGRHPLWRGLKTASQNLMAQALQALPAILPAGFDLRGASVGNLLFSAEYLRAGPDVDRALRLFERLLEVRGSVRPTSVVNMQLVAVHQDGARTVGQHKFGSQGLVSASRIDDLELVHGAQDAPLQAPAADGSALSLIESAELICFPMGSFFSSVLANLLPAGVGQEICARHCPKVYVPNAGHDPEMNGYSLADALQRLVEFVRRDAGPDVSARTIVDSVLIDPEHLTYSFALDLERVAQQGVSILETPLAGADPERVDPELLVRALVSLVPQNTAGLP